VSALLFLNVSKLSVLIQIGSAIVRVSCVLFLELGVMCKLIPISSFLCTCWRAWAWAGVRWVPSGQKWTFRKGSRTGRTFSQNKCWAEFEKVCHVYGLEAQACHIHDQRGSTPSEFWNVENMMHPGKESKAWDEGLHITRWSGLTMITKTQCLKHAQIIVDVHSPIFPMLL